MYRFRQDFYSSVSSSFVSKTETLTERVELTFILNAFVRTWLSCLCSNLSPINNSQNLGMVNTKRVVELYQTLFRRQIKNKIKRGGVKSGLATRD